MRIIRIPQDRVGSLIGVKGETRKMIQKVAGVKMKIDSEGEVTIFDDKAEDPLMGLKLVEVVKAIGRGFTPEKAMRLFQDDEYLEIVDIKEFLGGKGNQVSRIRARLIGTGGKTRSIIEDLTGVNMVIYGNTVAIMGDSISLPVAKHAVELILRGSEHSTVYKYLESQRPRLRIAEMGFDIWGLHMLDDEIWTTAVLDKASVAYGHGLCDHCLGRLFGKLDTGMTNDERGALLRKALGGLDAWQGPCNLCEDIFGLIPRLAEAAAESILSVESENFLIGTRVDPLINERESR
ncbi:MAG: KH domain-containing protein, partial [Candidatus Methanomethylophilaceae archaeon]